MTFRRLLARLHWWTGIVAMPVLLVVSLSGALLVAAPWLTTAEMPVSRAPGRARLSESMLLARAGRLLPPGDSFASIEWPGPARAQLITLRSGARWFVDPSDGSVLSRRDGPTLLEDVIAMAHQIHVRLVAGTIGEWMVTLATAVALWMSFSGVILWWRTKRFRMGSHVRGRRWYRDLHGVLGIYSSVVIVVLTTSGLLLAWEQPLYWLAHARPEREPPLPRSHERTASDPLTLGVDDWIATSLRAAPGRPIAKLSLPATERSAVSVQLGPRGGPERTTVWLDRWNAHVLRIDDSRTGPRAVRAHVFARAMHTGDVAGVPTALVALLGCLSLAALAITSLASWLLRPPPASGRARYLSS